MLPEEPIEPSLPHAKQARGLRAISVRGFEDGKEVRPGYRLSR
jgi:hypothetical protein